MNPASMTKILTVLVAAEHLTEADLDQTATITIDITDYSYVNDCSITGYVVDETVTVRDLFYGTILPSGADSAVALAVYVAGSHEAFVNLMNEKLAQLGLAGSSHFTNCVGLYDENHYTTAYDMAVMLKAAADNAFCREVMSAHTYTTSPTEQHPDGLKVSNLFLRRIEDRDTPWGGAMRQDRLRGSVGELRRQPGSGQRGQGVSVRDGRLRHQVDLHRRPCGAVPEVPAGERRYALKGLQAFPEGDAGGGGCQAAFSGFP